MLIFLTKSDVDYTKEHWTNLGRLQIVNYWCVKPCNFYFVKYLLYLLPTCGEKPDVGLYCSQGVGAAAPEESLLKGLSYEIIIG